MTNPTNPDNNGDRVGPYADPETAKADARIVAVRVERENITHQAAASERLHAECGRCGVTLGRYDRMVVDWLAGWPVEIGQVVLGLVARAYTSGYDRGSDS